MATVGFWTSDLSEYACLFETEISRPIWLRRTDDEMIEKLDLQHPGAFSDPPGQAKINIAGRRVT